MNAQTKLVLTALISLVACFALYTLIRNFLADDPAPVDPLMAEQRATRTEQNRMLRTLESLDVPPPAELDRVGNYLGKRWRGREQPATVVSTEISGQEAVWERDLITAITGDGKKLYGQKVSTTTKHTGPTMRLRDRQRSTNMSVSTQGPMGQSNLLSRFTPERIPIEDAPEGLFGERGPFPWVEDDGDEGDGDAPEGGDAGTGGSAGASDGE